MHDILLSPQGPARSSNSSWSIVLENPLGVGRRVRRSEVWRGYAQSTSHHGESRIHVVVRVFVKSKYPTSRMPHIAPLDIEDYQTSTPDIGWTEGKSMVDRVSLVYERLRSRQGSYLPYCYGLYAFDIDGENCLGFVLEDLTRSTRAGTVDNEPAVSVDSWIREQARAGTLTIPMFDGLMRAAFKTQDLFKNVGISLLHVRLVNLLLLHTHSDFVPVVAIGFSSIEDHTEVKKRAQSSGGQRYWYRHTDLALFRSFKNVADDVDFDLEGSKEVKKWKERVARQWKPSR